MVANRSVGTGLTCSAVFSSWMWINESVFSAAYTYKWGVALPIWWASGLSFQIALMAIMGIVAKLRVPVCRRAISRNWRSLLIGTVRAYISRVHETKIWQLCASDLHRPQPDQQRLRMWEYDPSWISASHWHDRHARGRLLYSHSGWW